MTTRPINLYAVRIPQRSGLPPCLYVPIAARDATAIEKFVGNLRELLAVRSSAAAFLVEAYEPEAPDLRLAIWRTHSASILHHPLQVWVHVDYSGYRAGYGRAFPGVQLSDVVLDHVMNRRATRLKGFTYLRIVPVARAVNSSHGGLSEKWAVAYQSSAGMREFNKASLAAMQYADLSDIVKMLNVEGGGSFMKNVNQAQKLVDLPDEK